MRRKPAAIAMIPALALMLMLALCACGISVNGGTPTPLPPQTAKPPVNTSPADTPTDDAVPNWGGWYNCDDTNFSIEITDSDEQGFRFGFYNLRNGEMFYDGAVSTYSADGLMAEYGEISFSLSGDFKTIDVIVTESSEWAHLSGRYGRIDNGKVTPYNDYNYSLRLDFRIDGLELTDSNDFLLDGEVWVYTGRLGGGNDIALMIGDYLDDSGYEVSEWLSIEEDSALSELTGYLVWVAEYTIGREEDTNLCLDAVVVTEEYPLILHTMRDADSDFNSDVDYGQRIRELFATIDVVTV